MIGLLKMPIANLQSVWNALYENGCDPILVDERSDFDSLTHLIVPGVGNFCAVMRDLSSRGLSEKIQNFGTSGRPLLGICVGMQILATWGNEGGLTKGLDIVPGNVTKIVEHDEVKLPHVGWNTVNVRRPHPLFEGIKPKRDFYFVHSYCFTPHQESDALGDTTYGREVTCVVGRENVVGVQFHPEKSQINGIKILENFCRWDGQC